MWKGTVQLGKVPLDQLAESLPLLLAKLARIEFAPNGQAIVDAQPLDGLTLLAGSHMMAGAAYGLVLEATEDTNQKLVFAAIEEASADRFAIIVTSDDPRDSIDQRWEIETPAMPTRLRLTTVQDSTKTSSLIDLDINLAELVNPHASDPISANLKTRTHDGWLSLRFTSRSELSYRAGLSNGAHCDFDQFTNRVRHTLTHLTVKAWIHGAAAVLRHVSKRAGNDPGAMLWQMTIGELAADPSRTLRQRLDQVVAQAA